MFDTYLRLLFCRNGNFADIRQAGSLHEFLVKLHQDYGPIAGFWWGQKFVVSTADPEIFQTQINLFNKPSIVVCFSLKCLFREVSLFYSGLF